MVNKNLLFSEESLHAIPIDVKVDDDSIHEAKQQITEE